jgi:hypothetical protein
MQTDVQRWLADLPPALAHHARLLEALVERVELDPRVRVLVVGCSFGRGQADELSDLDTNMGVADAAWPAFLQDVDPLVRGIGDVVDVMHHRIAGLGDLPHQRTYALYRDGVQLDLVVQPASAWTKGRTPDMVVLHDPDGRASRLVEPANLLASSADVHQWTFLAWSALADCVKYIRRGSLWEALDRLHEARNQVWRLWAVAKGVAQPSYGLTSVLDSPGTEFPQGIASTVPHLDRRELMAAALACAQVLDQVWSEATAAVRAHIEPLAIGAWVRSLLESMPLDS